MTGPVLLLVFLLGLGVGLGVLSKRLPASAHAALAVGLLPLAGLLCAFVFC